MLLLSLSLLVLYILYYMYIYIICIYIMYIYIYVLCMYIYILCIYIYIYIILYLISFKILYICIYVYIPQMHWFLMNPRHPFRPALRSWSILRRSIPWFGSCAHLHRLRHGLLKSLRLRKSGRKTWENLEVSLSPPTKTVDVWVSESWKMHASRTKQFFLVMDCFSCPKYPTDPEPTAKLHAFKLGNGKSIRIYHVHPVILPEKGNVEIRKDKRGSLQP